VPGATRRAEGRSGFAPHEPLPKAYELSGGAVGVEGVGGSEASGPAAGGRRIGFAALVE
jgi:hypothetical protein